MKTIKVMSIIGICFFVFSFIMISYFAYLSDPTSAAGFGIIILMYAVPYSVVCLIIANRNIARVNMNQNTMNIADQLIKLNDLKEKRVITEEEFIIQKSKLLKV